MSQAKKANLWFQQIRGPFLILSVALTLIGVATAHRHGASDWPAALLLLLGVTLCHVSVNLFNELSDFHTGIDARTERTPFSGGSGLLQAGRTTPGQVRLAAYGSLAAAALIGIYFCLRSGWILLLFMALGALAIRFYTTHLARWLIGELASGLTLGTLVVLGVHYALARSFSPDAVWTSIPPGILTSLLLFLNEFPDAEADRQGGRCHLVIKLGKARAALVYAAAMGLVFFMILAGPFLFSVPRLTWIAMVTLPMAFSAALTARKHFSDPAAMVKALGLNVGVVILTDLLLAVGYFLAGRG